MGLLSILFNKHFLHVDVTQSMLLRLFGKNNPVIDIEPDEVPVDPLIRLLLYQDIGDKRKLLLFDSDFHDVIQIGKRSPSSTVSSLSSSSRKVNSSFSFLILEHTFRFHCGHDFRSSSHDITCQFSNQTTPILEPKCTSFSF